MHDSGDKGSGIEELECTMNTISDFGWWQKGHDGLFPADGNFPFGKEGRHSLRSYAAALSS